MKNTPLKLALLIAILCSTLSATAYDFEIDGIRYNILSFTNYEAETTVSPNAELSETGMLIIPETVTFNGKTLSVIKIGDNSFKDICMKHVTIGNNVRVIGVSAFMGCKELCSTTAAAVTTIEDHAYDGCSNLESVTLGKNITSIGSYAFSSCSSMTQYDFASPLEVIGDYGFSNSGLTTISLRDNVVISNYAFANCKSLSSVNFNSIPSVLSVGEFYGCTALKDIIGFIIPQELPDYVFSECNDLNVENIFNSEILENIGNYSLANCSFPKIIEIKSNILQVGEHAMEGFCGDLKIMDSDTELRVNDNAFNGTQIINLRLGRDLSTWKFELPSSLVSLEIGPEVTAIAPPVEVAPDNAYYKGTVPGGAPFVNCVNLEKVVIEPTERSLLLAGTGKEINSTHSGGDYRHWYYHTDYSGLFSECPITDISIQRPIETITSTSYTFYRTDRYHDYHSTTSNLPFFYITTISAIDIDYDNFDICTLGSNLKELFIGHHVSSIPDMSSFSLNLVSVRNGTPPDAKGFGSSTYTNGKLLIPSQTTEVYKAKEPWCNFWQVEETDKLFDRITSIEFPEYLELKLGESVSPTVVIHPEYATIARLTWHSSDVGVVECSENGNITAKGVGTAEITINTNDGSGIVGKCYVHVVEEVEVVGFKNVYNSVTYLDMAVSTTESYFNYIPEIIGPFSTDDFWVDMWFLDKDKVYGDNMHEINISGGDYAGSYVHTNSDRPMYAGKYIVKLISKDTNPNVVANPARAYITVNRTSNNLEWNANSPITISVGEKVDLGIDYQADLWCEFHTDYDEDLIEVTSSDATGSNPHWYATGLKEGETTLYFSITCRKNEFGFYDFSDSNRLYKSIRITPSAGIEDVNYGNDNLSVSVVDGIIRIKNKPTNSIVRIFTLQGLLIKETYSDSIDDLSPNLYIVSVDGKSMKVKL